MPAEERSPSPDDVQAPRALSSAEPARQPPLVDSQSLFQGAQELLIQHGEQIYRLRQTRNGKLILNK